ncbi:MAG: inositol monophosphatase family protein [Minisyncoccia bacterium]
MDYARVLSIVRDTRTRTFPQFGIVRPENKSNTYHDVVTECDRAVEVFLKEKLYELDPSITFFGEEFGGNTTDRFWLCDPIDGTGHFVRGLPFCTTMLTLIENGVVTFSVIYDFVSDTLYHAIRGEGAYKNNVQIFVSTRALKEAYIVFESQLRYPQNAEKYAQLESMCALPATINCGWEFAMIAEGKFDGRITQNPYGKIWDFAPGSLLVSEAGGVVANIGRSNYTYTNLDLIATNKTIYEELTSGSQPLFPFVNEVSKPHDII